MHEWLAPWSVIRDAFRDRLQCALGDTYTIERELRGGAMAHEFVATDHRLDRTVVIKGLPDDVVVELSAKALPARDLSGCAPMPLLVNT